MQSISYFSASYNVTGKELDGVCLMGKCHFFTKHHTGSFYLSALFFKLRHTELKNVAAPFYSAIPQISANSSFSTAHRRGLKW